MKMKCEEQDEKQEFNSDANLADSHGDRLSIIKRSITGKP